jgi:tetratricopeptide (TPR) repeat protein
MSKKFYILVLFLGIIFLPKQLYAQVNFNQTPEDNLQEQKSDFQEYFFEALKQKGIENYERAIEYLQKCILINDTESILFLELGKNYSSLRNYVLAEEALKKALTIKPDNEWILDELYSVYIKQKDYDSAVKTIEQLVKYQPKYKEDLANIYAQTKDFKSALETLDELDEEFGVTNERELLRNKIYTFTGQQQVRIDNLEIRKDSNPEDESNYLKLIFRYSEEDNLDKAFETAQELLKVQPDSKLVHLALYKFYLQKNQPEDAINSMKIVLETEKIDPKSKSKVLSDFVNFASKNPKYEQELVTVISTISSKENALDLANYYYKKGDKSKALIHYKEAYKTQSQNFDILKQIILIQIDLEHFTDALKTSDEAIEIYPAQPLLYLLNGVALNALNRPKEAVDTLDIGVDYLIEDIKMEIDFYRQLEQAYIALNNLNKANSFKEKIAKLKK